MRFVEKLVKKGDAYGWLRLRICYNGERICYNGERICYNGERICYNGERIVLNLSNYKMNPK